MNKRKSSKKIIIIGGGCHARVLKDTLDLLPQYTVLGYTDFESCSQMDSDYLGKDEIIKKYKPSGVLLVNGLGSIHLPVERERVYRQFKSHGYTFASVIHPKAVISSKVTLSEGVQIMAGVVINVGSQIKENVIINTSSSIDHDCMIDAHTHIAPGVVLSGLVNIGSGSHIGTGARVIQGVNIGDKALVAAGSVVVNDVPSKGFVLGVPARKK